MKDAIVGQLPFSVTSVIVAEHKTQIVKPKHTIVVDSNSPQASLFIEGDNVLVARYDFGNAGQ